MLDKGTPNNVNHIESKVGQRGPLSSNKVVNRCPTLGINPNEVSEDVALDYLASILAQAFLDRKEDEYIQTQQSKTSSDICPGVNERTS
jgi:hypothetical protein